MTSPSPVPGHLFVVQADVTTIKSDAWLCPTDPDFRIEPAWRKALGMNENDEILHGHDWGVRRAAVYIPENSPPSAITTPVVLGDVGRVPPSSPEEVEAAITDLLPVVEDFAEVALEQCSKSDLEAPLRLALPLIGTGEGGLRGIRGQALEPLLTELERVARERRVDFLLCTSNALAYSAAQAARQMQNWHLSEDEENCAVQLADKASRKDLVLFIGAGASQDIGLPGWRELLEKASHRLCDLSEPDRKGLSKLDLRDHATLIETELGRAGLLSEVATQIGGHHRPIGLTHALLASLGARQAITTNYDNLYERACTLPNQKLEDAISVLPYGRVEDDKPWLLKLHGSLQDGAEDIVITRADYMRLRQSGGALYGIVQALLVTKHLLFVGYSLSDDDFHELVDEIRIALGRGTGERRPLGTVLTLKDSVWGRLWEDLLNVVQFGAGANASGPRQLQIFLDRVAHLASPHYAYLLDRSFEGLLDEEERQIASGLRDFYEQVAASRHPTAVAVRQALEIFGDPR